MIIAHKKSELRDKIAAWRGENSRIGAVLTMGALHEGHLSLIDAVRERCDRVTASVFVNPKQFAPGEDLDAYPRTLERDAELLRERGCDLVFAPNGPELYPENFSTRIVVEDVTANFEGASRPHFFEGVATVVTKLLMILAPDLSAFGEKDYQQLVTIKRLIRDLEMPVEIIGVPTAREESGLAMSSRNQYLSKAERAIAPALYQTLSDAAAKLGAGAADAKTVSAQSIEKLKQAGFDKIDYFELADAEILAPMARADRPGRLLAAGWLGKTRLIDNVAVVEK